MAFIAKSFVGVFYIKILFVLRRNFNWIFATPCFAKSLKGKKLVLIPQINQISILRDNSVNYDMINTTKWGWFIHASLFKTLVIHFSKILVNTIQEKGNYLEGHCIHISEFIPHINPNQLLTNISHKHTHKKERIVKNH